MVNPLAAAAGVAAFASLFEAVGAFTLNMLKHDELKREREERREQERRQDQRQAQRDGEWKTELKKRQEELDLERQDRIQADNESKREGRAREERDREARREQEKWHEKMQAKRDVEHEAAMKRQEEVLERERRYHIEAERRRDREADNLREYVKNCIMIFSQLMRQQQHQQRHCRCHECQNQSNGHWARTFEYSSEHKIYKKHSAPYSVELAEDFDDDQELLSVFNTSLLQGSSSHSSDASQSFKLLEFLERPTADFEDKIYSMVLAKINVDQAKEEGNAYFKDQKFVEARKCYTKSIDQAPTAIGYANRGLAYFLIDKFIESEEDCTQSLKIDGYYFKAYARRARARTKLGYLDGALEDVDFALQLEPLHQEMENLRAELKCLLSKAPTSGRAYDHKKENAIQAKEEGNNYFKDQRFDKAIKCYSESIDILPTGAGYAHRAEAYLKLNKYAEVEEDCTEALKLDYKDFKVYAGRAVARKSLMHNLKGALMDVESALDLEPTDLEMKKLRAELMNSI